MPITAEFILVSLLAFIAYYIGIVIRKFALPGKDSPTLGKQLLLGIPVSLVVVSPLIALLNAAVKGGTSNLTSVLVSLGIIMKHGMIFNETLSKHLKSIVEGKVGAHNNA